MEHKLTDRETKTAGKLLRAIREAGGMTQVEVAARMGIAQTELSRLETGRRRIKVEDLPPWAAALGLTRPQLQKEALAVFGVDSHTQRAFARALAAAQPWTARSGAGEPTAGDSA